MKPVGDARKHYWRTLKMAKAMGVPLATALRDSRLSRSDYAEIVENCRRCPNPGHCTELLAHGEALTSAPGYCTNRDTFAALKAELAKDEGD